MNRRDFVRLTGSGLTAGALAESAVAAQVAARQGAAPASSSSSSRARMKAGTQHGDSDPILRALAGFGVNHICSRLPSAQMGPEWSVEALTKRRRPNVPGILCVIDEWVAGAPTERVVVAIRLGAEQEPPLA